MGAEESRFGGGRGLGRGRYPAVLATLLSCLFQIFRQFPCLRQITAIAVAAGLVMAPLPPAFAFSTGDNAAHAVMAGQESADHGHGHGDDAHGPSTGHTHGHDPADHSHQYAFLSGGSSQWGLPPAQRWPSALSGRPDPAIGLGIERPPKRAMSL